MLPTAIYPAHYLNFGINPSDMDYLRQISDLQIRCNYLEAENSQLKQVISELTDG
jgi:cell division protein FtsB